MSITVVTNSSYLNSSPSSKSTFLSTCRLRKTSSKLHTSKRKVSVFCENQGAETTFSSIVSNASPLLLEAFSADEISWTSAFVATSAIFLLGSPLLLSGLNLAGYFSAFALGLVTWRAFGPSGFLIVSVYFILGTMATKVKLKQKEKEGIAEKRGGKRGPESVIGSSAAAVFCAVMASLPISPFLDPRVQGLLRLGFLANFCTKLSDTAASEVGKAFGKTTYLVTSLERVPRGTEGAISVEGTLAGVFGAVILALVGYFNGQVNATEAAICVLSSQVANFGESYIGATLQDKPGFKWMTNDVVNVLNISAGTALAILLRTSFPG